MRTRGFTLVSTLMTIVIIALLMVVMFYGSSALSGKAPESSRPDGKGKTIYGAAQYKAKDEVCRSNLNQLRQSIQIYRLTADETPPSTLEETRLGPDFYRCPIGQEPYRYDPTTAQVQCPHPGHELY